MENDIEEERQTNAAELQEALDWRGKMTQEDFFDVSGTGITGTDGNIDWTKLIGAALMHTNNLLHGP
jgi:hypothetical protein